MRVSATDNIGDDRDVKLVVLPSHMRVSATAKSAAEIMSAIVVLPSHMRVSATNSKSTYRRVGPSTWSVPIT